jgi:FtsP/CotA-like multicopper oxidase with cupredoxin domain
VLIFAFSPCLPAQQAPETTDPHPAHAAHGGAIPGLKKELFAGITEADFLKLSEKPNTVKLILIATYTEANYGMNFNGYAKGAATVTVPKDWTVEVEFINPSPVPHSAIVCERADVKKLQVSEPYFAGAAVEKHLVGIAMTKASFTFKADEAGEFAFACGFPAHAIAGHWIALDVSADAKTASIKLGDKPALEAK